MVSFRPTESALCIYLVLVHLTGLIWSSDVQVSSRHEEISLQATPNLPPSEMAALQDFYNSCNGPNWFAHIGKKWNFTSMTNNPCTQHWQGITCKLIQPHYHVHSINMAISNIVGELPNSLANLTQLAYFSAVYNHINGTVPAFLGSLINLELLDLSTNKLSGSVPPSFGNLKNLESLDLSVNDITGRLPDSLGNLAKLTAISFGDNRLSGPMPIALARLTKLQAMHFYYNHFTGTIPVEMCNFTKVTIFDFAHNVLTGTIPAAIGNMTSMSSFSLNNNGLTGSLPATFAVMTVLEDIEVYSNFLSGTIPDVLGDVRTMQILALYNNSLTGTLPNAIQNMTQLQYLYVDSNQLTGTIPASVGNLSNLIIVDMHANHFDGTMPAFGGKNSTRLQYLTLNNNLLTGAIPTSVSNLAHLKQFQVQYNQLSGPLEGRFSPSTHRLLTTIQVNNNQLTGELPAEMFLLPLLYTFAAVSNCFEGVLPPTVCNSSTLDSLVLDGLSSAKACRDTLLPGISRSYITQQSVYGTIPPCLFTLSTLTTLHLSGNGFTGPLPGNLTIAEALVDLTLSHNLLTGSIPQEFQARQWLNIDLSYNKFGGTLISNFSSSRLNGSEIASYDASLGLNSSVNVFIPTLLLANNRLSGHIPAAVKNEQNISILGTNVFSCKLDRSDLPAHDSGRENYQCGSDSFDVPYYVWLSLTLAVLCALLLAVVIAMSRAHSDGTEQMTTLAVLKWIQLEVPMRNITAVQRTLSLFRDLALWISAYVLVVLLPLYCVLAHFYGTLTYQYAWGVSAAYLSGSVPVAWEFALWIMLLCIVLGLFVYLQRARASLRGAENVIEGTVVKHELRRPPVVSAAKSAAIYAIFISINLMVVIGVNSAYVYVAIYQSTALLVLAQFLISLFKIVWNNICTELILRQIVKYLHAGSVDSSTSAGLDAQFASLQVFVALLNNIAIPCLVVAMISPDCFYNLFDAAPAVSSQFSYLSCVLDGTFVCKTFKSTLVDTQYDPPFRYSYQCSSSFITYYAPAFVILCLVVTFVNPALQMLMLYFHQRAKADSEWFKVLDTLLPRILKPISADPAAAGTPVLDRNRLYFDANRVLIIALTFLGLLLTFGAVFPPLAVAICLTVLSVVYWAKYKLGRFLSAAQEQQLQGYVEVIERECAQVGSSAVLHNSMWMLITVSCCFYTLFLFDTLGDAVGFDDALWVLIVMPMFPVVLFAITSLYCVFEAHNTSKKTLGTDGAEEVSTRETELVPVGSASSPFEREFGDGGATLNILQSPGV